jgi:hypothetical protein
MLAARAQPVPDRPKNKRWCAKHTAGEQPRLYADEARPMKHRRALAANGRTARVTAATVLRQQHRLANSLHATATEGTAIWAWARSNAFDCRPANVLHERRRPACRATSSRWAGYTQPQRRRRERCKEKKCLEAGPAGRKQRAAATGHTFQWLAKHGPTRERRPEAARSAAVPMGGARVLACHARAWPPSGAAVLRMAQTAGSCANSEAYNV